MSFNLTIKIHHYINNVANSKIQAGADPLTLYSQQLHSSLLHFIDCTDIYESVHNFISN